MIEPKETNTNNSDRKPEKMINPFFKLEQKEETKESNGIFARIRNKFRKSKDKTNDKKIDLDAFATKTLGSEVPKEKTISIKEKLKQKLQSFQIRAKRLKEKIPFKKLSIFLLVFIIFSVIFTWIILWVQEDILLHKEISEQLKNTDFDTFVGASFGLLVTMILLNILYVIEGGVFNRYNVKIIFASNTAIPLIICGIFLGTYVFKHPEIQSHYPEYDSNLPDYAEPLEVRFNLPVGVDKLKPSIVQEWEGRWEWEPYLGINSITRVGKFYPKVSALPDQRFVLYIAGINKLTDKTAHEYGFVFKAPTLPEISATIPVEGDNSVTATDAVNITVNKHYKELVDWTFEFEPTIEFDIDESEPKKIKLQPKDKWSQGKTYTLTAKYKPKVINLETGETVHSENPIEIKKLKFSIVKEPLIENFSPTGSGIRPDSQINITFAEEMDIDSVVQNLSISPEVAGKWEVKDSKNVSFKPAESFIKSTKFTTTLKSGARSAKGGVIEKDIVYEFETVGKVKVAGFSPGDGQNYVNEWDGIKIFFDQEVDKASAEASLVVSPGVSGTFRWDGNTMIYDLSQPFNYQTTYQIKINAGVKSVYGEDSNQEFVSTFYTRANFVQFYIPLYYQPPGFACNIFTAKMVLASKGIYVDYTSIISAIGYNDNRSGNQWTGNPYAEYVGTWDGSWGYGVYYPPIQNYLASWGVGSEPHVGWDVASMARAIEQGHPVIIWRYNGVGGGQNISWTASDGTYVNAFNGMHGSVISGFIGTADNPSSFYINDPWLGQYWIDTGTLDYFWSFSGRMALVVY